MMQSSQTAFIVLFLFALIMMAIGFQGNVGILIGIIFCPQYILIGSEIPNG